MARRHGNTWYIAGINAGYPWRKVGDGLLFLNLDLSWLDATSLTIYSGGDNPTAQPLKLKKGMAQIKLPKYDGFVIVAE